MRAFGACIAIGVLAIGLFIALGLSSTEYTGGYTPGGFNSVTNGMDEEQVHRILGKPHHYSLYLDHAHVGEDGKSTAWAAYSRFDNKRRFAMAYSYRAICLSNGIVIAKASGIRWR